MPYIITTRTFDHAHTFGGVPFINPPTRTAVATWTEAMQAAQQIGFNRNAAINPHTLTTFPVSGGTIGPLPDGTVIEVRHANTIDKA